MAKRKKEPSRTMIEASKRVSGGKALDENLDLGNNLKISVLENKLKEAQNALDEYNQSLTIADTKLNIFQTIDRELRELSGRFLTGAASKHGKNSSEYEAMGGTRTSERKKVVRNTPTP